MSSLPPDNARPWSRECRRNCPTRGFDWLSGKAQEGDDPEGKEHDMSIALRFSLAVAQRTIQFRELRFLSSSKGLLARTGELKSHPTALGLAYSLKLLIEELIGWNT